MFGSGPKFRFSLNCVLLFLCFSFFGFKVGFGIAYITEVSFNNPEYIEIFSDEKLNLSEFIITDDSKSKSGFFNEVFKFETSDSNYLYLIAGSNFINNSNLSLFNSTIYSTGKNEITGNGLRNDGENFSISSNLSDLFFNFSVSKVSLKSGNSYHYDINKSEYFISEQTPGILSFMPVLQNQTNLTNQTNQSQNLSINFTESCNYSFKVLTKSDIFEDKLEFWFDTNATGYEIEYYVEDYLKVIKKNKVKTKNLDKKSFSSDLGTPEVYYVRGTLVANDCEISNFSKVMYYPKTKEVLGRSSIKILNSNEILSGIDDFVEYEVYRGETDKRTIYFKINGKEFNKFEIEKFSKIVGQISLPKIIKNSVLEISGLDKIETLEIEVLNLDNLTTLSNLSNVSKTTNSSEIGLKISSFEVFEDYVNFSLFGFNFSGFCYVYQDRTLISSKLFVNKTGNYNLSLNLSKIDIEKNESEFKLTCKYKKGDYSSDFYDNFVFDYNLSLIGLVLEDNSSCDNCFSSDNSNLSKSYFEVNETYLAVSDENSGDLVLNASLEKSAQNSSEKMTGYVSKSSNLKQNSFFFVFLACVILVIILIFKR